MKPASRIKRSISSVVVRFVVFAADTTFSSIMSDPKSLQPKRSAICPTFIPIVTQLHDLEPPIGAGFFRRDDVAHPLHQNLTAATGDGVKPGFAQLPDDVERIH